MTRLFRTFLMLAFAPLVFPQTAAAEEALAMIADLKGTAEVVEQGDAMPANLLDYLYPGTELRVSAGGEATVVYFSSGVEYRYGADTRVKIAAGEPKVLAGKGGAGEKVQIAHAINLAGLTGGGVTQGAITFRAVRKPARLELLDPKEITLLNPRPEFHWRGLGEGAGYRFTLSDGSGRVLLETDVQGERFVLPESVKLARGESFSWQVEGRAAGGETYSSNAVFSLLDEAKSKEISALRPKDDDRFSSKVLYATYLESLGLAQDARAYWGVLAAERPDSTMLQEKLR